MKNLEWKRTRMKNHSVEQRCIHSNLISTIYPIPSKPSYSKDALQYHYVLCTSRPSADHVKFGVILYDLGVVSKQRGH